MDLIVCTICGDDHGTSECHLVVFTVDVVIACNFVVPAHSSPSHPIRVLVVLAMPVNATYNGRQFS